MRLEILAATVVRRTVRFDVKKQQVTVRVVIAASERTMAQYAILRAAGKDTRDAADDLENGEAQDFETPYAESMLWYALLYATNIDIDATGWVDADTLTELVMGDSRDGLKGEYLESFEDDEWVQLVAAWEAAQISDAELCWKHAVTFAKLLGERTRAEDAAETVHTSDSRA